MKDRLLLFAVGSLCAVVAWLFWRVSGQWGFLILGAVSCAGLLAHNARLRRQVRELQGLLDDRPVPEAPDK